MIVENDKSLKSGNYKGRLTPRIILSLAIIGVFSGFICVKNGATSNCNEKNANCIQKPFHN